MTIAGLIVTLSV